MTSTTSDPGTSTVKRFSAGESRAQPRLRHLVPMLICALLVMTAAPADAVWQDTVRATSTTSAGQLTSPVDLSCLGNLAGGTLSWNQVPDAVGYEVVGPLGSLGTLLNGVLSLVGGVLSYTLPAVSLGAYKVRAVIPGTTWVSPYTTVTASLNAGLHLVCS